MRWSRVWHWTPGDGKTRVLAGAVLVLFAVPALAICATGFAGRGNPAGAFNDFFATWSVAKLFAAGEVARVYDFAFLTAFRQSLDSAFDVTRPFAIIPYTYPPLSLFLLWPLSLLPFRAAYIGWMGFTFVLYVGVALAPVAGKWRPAAAALLLLAPASIYTAQFGQNGFLTAALLTAGLRLAAQRPALAGVLLGLLAFKPQVAILVPVALAAAGLWRAFAATAIVAALLAGASVAAFGLAMWAEWVGAVLDFSRNLELHGQALYHLLPTAMANALVLGTPWPLARGLQLLVTLLVAAATWLAFRRGAGGMAIAALQVGTVLATPYAFIYDLPVVTLAVLAIIQDRARTGAAFALPELAIIAATLALPYFMVAGVPRLPLSAGLLVLLFGMVMRRIPSPRGQRVESPAIAGLSAT